jgi:hypothetical protein
MTRFTPRTRTSLTWIVAVMAGLVLTAGRAGVAQDTEARTIYAIVLDDANTPVTDLEPEEVTVVEDGTPRQVTTIAPAADPLSVGLLIDTAQPPMGNIAPIRDLRTALNAFVNVILSANAASEIAIMETGGAAVITRQFTSSAQDLTRAVNRLIQTQRTSAVVLEGILSMSQAIGARMHTRRAIVTVDFDSPDPSRVIQDQFAEAMSAAGASVWGVSVRRGGGGAAGRDAILDWATETSGGLRVTSVSAAALEAQMRTVAAALASHYAVTYRRAPGGSIRDLRLVATRGSKFLVTRATAKQ